MEIPVKIMADEGDKIYSTYSRGGTYGGTTGAGRQESVSVDALSGLDAIWVTEFTNKSWSGAMRRKLLAYAEAHKLIPEDEMAANRSIYLTDAKTPPGGAWLDDAVRIDWAAVRAWRDPEMAQARGGGPLSYPIVVNGGYVTEIDADELPDTELYYYIGGRKDTALRAAARALGGPDVVILPSTRAAKFQRLFPHAEDASEVAKVRAEAWLRDLGDRRRETLTERARTSYSGWSEAANIVEKMGDGLDDPSLARLLDLKGADCAAAYEDWSNTFVWLLPPLDSERSIWDTAVEKYPLLNAVSTYSRNERMFEHLKLYVNAVYAATQSEGDSQ
jgi:hypothetical protein